ncbi:MAG: AmmeMemoRadiSam system radical SAM enzyme [Planctomycetaceae bacterium]|nr:AmmeMemoRadiSam system radical SAM enzyme [Planctomycetaceae bacterium]
MSNHRFERHPQAHTPTQAKWWHSLPDSERIICDLCPRECSLKPDDRGFCFVRQNIDGQMQLTTYGRSTGFCIDPIEKKPLNHFLPGTPVLSFGTAGCNLGCQFCQNWDISKSREVERLSEVAMPEQIVQAALQTGCRSVAFTYNDPIVWAEYAIDTANACRAAGIQAVAVTAGYIHPDARAEFFHPMNAANVDLKAITEEFYHHITYSHLKPVLETLAWLKNESDVWFEITNLIIPQANDSADDLQRMCDWILSCVGDEVPVHFSAFHPDFRMNDRERTPHETLLKAKQIALSTGIKFVYVGNVNDKQNQSTWCPQCKHLLIERDWYELGAWALKENQCSNCGYRIPGVFEAKPGVWGRKRQPIRISQLQNLKESQMANSVKEKPRISKLQEDVIHRSACELVLAAVQGTPALLTDETLANAANTTVMGVFVTLKKAGQLRGCIGRLGQPMPLLTALRESATRTATSDPRFRPVSFPELSGLTLDVTLLFNFETMPESVEDRLAGVEVGRHGLRIQLGSQAGLLLPSVPVEQGWDAITFLVQVCRKAGMPANAWKDPKAALERFEGRMIEGSFDHTLIQSVRVNQTPSRFTVTRDQIQRLNQFSRSNVLALIRGAVPACMLPAGCDDGPVSGLAMQLTFKGTSESILFSRLYLKGEIPFQSTLMQICQSAADWCRKHGRESATLNQLQTDLAVFHSPLPAGSVAKPSFANFRPGEMGLAVSAPGVNAWLFDSAMTGQDLWTSVFTQAADALPPDASLHTFTCQATCPAMQKLSFSTAGRFSGVRKPAVAGTFYPAAAAELRDLVSDCFHRAPTPPCTTNGRRNWPAVMVPHAGLRYSGHIAAGAFKLLDIPDTAIIIGPRHTPEGCDFALAPWETWNLPTGTMDSDTQTSSLLLSRVDGLRPDAAAHAGEHSIELELPLIQYIAPKCKVVGITVGRLSLEACLTAGRQLGQLLQQSSPPSIVNHLERHESFCIRSAQSRTR